VGSTLAATVSGRRSITAATMQMEYTCSSWQDFSFKATCSYEDQIGDETFTKSWYSDVTKSKLFYNA